MNYIRGLTVFWLIDMRFSEQNRLKFAGQVQKVHHNHIEIVPTVVYIEQSAQAGRY